MLFAQELLKIGADVVEIRSNNARLTRLLYESGKEDRGAWILSEANLSQARFDLSEAKRARDLSERQLITVIGRNLDRPIRALGEMEISDLPESPDFDQLATRTPAVIQSRAEADAAAAGITIAQSGFYPAVTLDGALAQRDSIFFPEAERWSAGFSVSIPLFEGGSTYFNVRAARALLQQALANLRSGTDQAALTLAQAFKELVDAAENARVQQELLEATQLRYTIAETAYRNGLISFQDFNSITNNYVDQQREYSVSRRDAVIAESNWEQARGTGAIP
jgi:outer membrane protein TolC